MWRLQDARRHHRRVSAHEHLQTLHRHDLTRERLPHLRPSAPLRRPAGAPVRRLLISWLFAESSALALHPATPALAASYLDRLLPLPRAPLPRAQPLAAACLLLAAKLSEVGGDAIDVAYRLSVRVALPLELLALDLLRWDLVAPTPYTFLVFFARRVWLPAAARAAAAAHLNRALLCTFPPRPREPAHAPTRRDRSPTPYAHPPETRPARARLPPLVARPRVRPASRTGSPAPAAVQAPRPG